jgi:hypothetical protein
VLDDEINDGKPWYYDICNFVEDRTYPEGVDRKDRRALRLLLPNTSCAVAFYIEDPTMECT